MTATLASTVELLERSLGYTRVALAEVTEAALGNPTPCHRWTLRDLLRHMDDALDAFTEAAGGSVALTPRPATPSVGALQQKACALLGRWSRESPDGVQVGRVGLATDLLVATAALEITVHGWDVARATGTGAAIPAELARDLLPIAHRTVLPADRGLRFDAARPTPAGVPADTVLLAFLGRSR